MLVVPDHWGDSPIRAGTPFASRLRAWSDAGVDMFVHGWFHLDRSEHDGALAKFKAKRMTAGEGEFLGLDHATARARMADGRKLIEDIIGRPAAGFIAPAWLYGDGAMQALRRGRLRAGRGSYEGVAPRHRRGRRPRAGHHLGEPQPLADRLVAHGGRRGARRFAANGRGCGSPFILETPTSRH